MKQQYLSRTTSAPIEDDLEEAEGDSQVEKAVIIMVTISIIPRMVLEAVLTISQDKTEELRASIESGTQIIIRIYYHHLPAIAASKLGTWRNTALILHYTKPLKTNTD